MVYLFLANGFETMEALAPLDLMRRADITVKTVGITGATVESAQGVCLQADLLPAELTEQGLEGIVLPGGGKGTEELNASPVVHHYIEVCNCQKLLIAAICAAPSILAQKGLLNDKKATAYPGFQELIGHLSELFVVKDNNFITAKGAGVSVDFGLEIVKYLKGASASNHIREAIQCI